MLHDPCCVSFPLTQAFAEFESSEEAVRAMSARNGDYIGDRYVKLLRVPPEEMEEQTGGMGGGLLGSSPSGGMLGVGSGFGIQPGFAQGPGMRPQQPGQVRPAAWGQVSVRQIYLHVASEPRMTVCLHLQSICQHLFSMWRA